VSRAEEVAGSMPDRPDLKTLFERCDVAGPATSEAIATAEAELEVRFPPQYRGFLLTHGAALCDGFEIAGLFQDAADEPPLWSNVVTRTKRLRKASGGSIPNHFVAVADDGGDYKFYLDTSRRDDFDECPVVVLGPGADEIVVAHSFAEFVGRFSTDELSW
jgi:cell wall assembly regulator SMI1